MAVARDDRAAPVRALGHATRQSLRLDRDALVWPRAARQTAGVALCLFGGNLLGHPVPGAFAGIGALLTAIWSTPLGGRREVTGALPAVVALAGGTAAGVWAHQHLWLLVPLAAVSAAVTGLLATRPAPWSTVGTALTFGLVVTGAIEPFAQPAWVRGLVVGAGGLVQLALVVGTWPLQGVRPERRALRLLLRDIAAQLGSVDDGHPLPPVVPLPELSAALQAPQPFASRGAVTLVRAEYRAVVALRRTVARFLVDVRRAEAADAPSVREARIERRLAARVCRLLAGPRRPGWRAQVVRAIDDLRSTSAAGAAGATSGGGATTSGAGATGRPVTSGGGDLREVTAAMADDLAAVAAPLLARGARAAGSADPGPAVDVYAPPRARAVSDRVLAGLRDAAGDPLGRVHAVRMAVGVALAVAAGAVLPIQRGYWIALVVLVVVQPVVADTTGRVVARAAGTVVGVALALPAIWLSSDDVVTLLAFGVVLAGVAVLTFGASYLVFTAGVTGFVCLLLTLSGDPIEQLAAARVVDTGIGLLIVAGVALAAPSWEVRRTGAQLSAAVAAQLDYLALALERLGTPVDPDAVVVAESRAVDTRLAARESLRRTRQEPRIGRDRWDTAGPALLALVEEQAHRSLVLHARIDAGAVDVDPHVATELAAAARQLDADLTAALRDGRSITAAAPDLARIAGGRRPGGQGQGDVSGADPLAETARTLVEMRRTVAHAVR